MNTGKKLPSVVLLILGIAAAGHARAETLVSNLELTDTGTNYVWSIGSLRLRQKFTTGSEERYLVTAARVKFKERAASAIPEMRMYSVNSDRDSLGNTLWTLNTLWTFMNPSSMPSGTNIQNAQRTVSFTAPENSYLEGNTDYFLMIRRTGSGALKPHILQRNDESGLPGWSISDRAQNDGHNNRSLVFELQGEIGTSTDTGLGAYWFSTRGEGVRTIRDDTLTQFNHIARQTTASTTINVRARHPDAETTFVVNGTAMTGEHTKFSITGLTAGTITPVVIRVTAEDGVTTRDYTVRLGRRAKEPTIKSPDAILSANITVAEWGNGMKGVFDSGPLYGWLAPKTFDVPGSERQGRLAAVVSVDMSTFRGFYANTIAACFWKSYTVPEGPMLNQMRMNLDGTDFHFKDATRFTPRGVRCYRWPRPASGFDWSFGEVKKVELFAGVGNTPATGRHLISNPGGTGDGSLRYNNLIAVDYSNIRDADGLTRTDEMRLDDSDEDNPVYVLAYPNYTWRHQWIRVDGGSEEEIPEPEGTASSYLVQADDRGKAIKVRTTFWDDAGNEESLVSETLPVLPGTLDTSVPMRNGEAMIWDAVLTPTTYTTRQTVGCRAGCGTGTPPPLSVGSFSFGGITHNVYEITQTVSGSDAGRLTLQLSIAAGLRGSEHVERMTLTVGNARLPLAGADEFAWNGSRLVAQWLDNDVTLTAGTAVTVALLRPTMNATLEKQPTEEGKNGKPAYVFDLKLGERLALKVADMRSNVFEVTRGTITHTKRIDKRIRHPGGIRTAYSNHWRIRVAPDASTLAESATERTVVVSLPVKACSEPGALCAGGIWVLGEAPEPLVFGPGGRLSIAIGDVTASESSGRMRFPITLTRPSDWDIRLEYEITGGTATKGVDYVDPKTQGGGRDHVLVLAGRTSPKLQFDLVEDAIDDDGETITVQITSARLLQPNLVRYASDLELVLSDATATGTIENSGIMPKAWLARFGRTVASQAVDAIGGRMEGNRTAHVTVGGQTLWSADTAPQGEAPVNERLFENLLEPEASAATRTLSADDILRTSSFSLSAGGSAGAPAWTAWGRVATGGFEAVEEKVELDGQITSAFLGADASTERWLAGVAVSVSEGKGGYTHTERTESGDIESSLTAIYPYARLRLSDTLDAWTFAGIGEGELALTESTEAQAQRTHRPDISMRMAAVGTRGEVISPASPGDLAVSIKTDAFWVRTTSEKVTNLAASEADVGRIRLLGEGTRELRAGAGTLTPAFEVGLRHDSGDAETGLGIEAGARIRYTAGRLAIEGAARTLLVHEAGGLREWGASATLRLNPSTGGHGLSMRLAPTWGAPQSAMGQLWSVDTPNGLARDQTFEPDHAIAAEVGYGLDLGHAPGVLTPYTGITVGNARSMRTGARWRVSERAALSIEAARWESSGADTAKSSIRLEARVQF